VAPSAFARPSGDSADERYLCALTVDGASEVLAVELLLAVALGELVSELEAVDVSLAVALADGVCEGRAGWAVQAM
jgi:hypothetical protein